MQESKRSAKDLCGRTDGNTKVIFPKEDVPAQPAESNTASVNAGDYVLVEVHTHSTSLKTHHIFTISSKWSLADMADIISRYLQIYWYMLADIYKKKESCSTEMFKKNIVTVA